MQRKKMLALTFGFLSSSAIVLTFDFMLFAQEFAKERETFKGHPHPVIAVAFSPDGKTLATSDSDTVKLWDVAKSSLRVALPEKRVWTLAFSPDGKTLATGGGGILGAGLPKEAKLWNVSDGKMTATFGNEDRFVQGVAFSPDGKTLAVGDWGEKVRLLDIASGKVRATFEGSKFSDPVMQKIRSATPNSCVAFSPDGKTMAAGSDGIVYGQLVLWDVATGKEKAIVRHKVNSVVFTADGKTLATTGGNDGVIDVCIWEASTGKEKSNLRGHTKFTSHVAISCDGIIASASADKTVKLWDLAKGKAITTLSHASETLSVAFSKDGKTLACGCMDGTVRIWHVSGITKVSD